MEKRAAAAQSARPAVAALRTARTKVSASAAAIATAASSTNRLGDPLWLSIVPLIGLRALIMPVTRRTPLTDATVWPAQEIVTQGSRKASSATVLAIWA